MKKTITKTIAALMLISAIGAKAQCTLNAAISATPNTTPGLNYSLQGGWSGGTNTWDYLNVIETGANWQGVDSANYTFPGSGNYTVCYYVTDSSNMLNICSDSTCVIVSVNGNGATNCSANLNLTANANGNYIFQATPIIPPGWTASYSWNYGDGNSGTGNPSNHTYTLNSSFTVTLTVTAVNPNDTTQFCVSNATGSAYVNNANGASCFVYLYSIANGGNNYDFHAGISSGYTSYYVINSWTIDGIAAGTSSDTMVSAIFNTVGAHTACLTQMQIDNASGDTCLSQNCTTVYVGTSCTLTAGVTATPDTAGSLHYLLAANHNGFNSGSYFSVSPGGGSLNNLNPDSAYYTFTSPGNYTVCYYITDSTATDTSGLPCQTYACIYIYVGGNGPITCSANFSSSNIGNGTFSFYGTANSNPGYNTSYLWVFGDGTNSGANPGVHTYSANGTYTVFLTTTTYDPNDSTVYCTSTFSDSVVVNNANGSTCNAHIDTVYNGGGNYSFTNTFTSNYTTFQKYSSWNVDGVYAGTGDSLNHTFTTNGGHIVCVSQVMVDNSNPGDSCFTSDCIAVNFYSYTPCNAYFILWQDTTNQYQWYGYNYSTGSSSMTYLWDFGDGATSTQQLPTHNYAVTGYYNVCLTVTDTAANCTDSYCDTAGVYKLMSGGGISGLTILSNPTGIKETATQVSANVFPNPLTENSQLSISSDKPAKLILNIFNVMGEKVSSEQVNISAGKNNIQLRTNELSGGIYFLNISDGNKNLKNIKLVK